MKVNPKTKFIQKTFSSHLWSCNKIPQKDNLFDAAGV